MAARFPDQVVHFASCNKSRDIKTLSELVVSMLPFHVHLALYTQRTFYVQQNTVYRHSQDQPTCNRNERACPWHA